MVMEIGFYWLGLGVFSAILSGILVVYPSRKIAEQYFIETYGLSSDNFYMYSFGGCFLHYTVHTVLSILSGPIVGFLSTLAKDAAVTGYTKSIIVSVRDDIVEVNEDDEK